MKRREAIKSGLGIFSLAFASAFAFSEFSNAKPVLKLRPPGSVDENDFLSRCIRCGLCVDACPFDTLKLAQLNDNGIKMGTPFFQPRQIPCHMCTDIPCVPVCPTSALDKNLVSTDNKLDITKAKMGVAVVDDKNCVAYFGVQCDACYRACPLLDKAIFIDYKRNTRTGKHAKLLPVVDTDFCTGCGLCEHACITKKAAITVLPRELVIGELNDTYVRGWVDGDDKRIQNTPSKVKLNPKKSLDYLNSGDDE